MAGPGLPVTVDSTWADSATDASVKQHQQHHDALHAFANRYDVDAVPSGGQVPTFDATSGLYKPATPAGGGGPTFMAVSQGGSVDNRAAINALIDQANAVNGAVELGPGLHRLTGPLNALYSATLYSKGGSKITLASGYTGGLRVKITDGATTQDSTTLTSTSQAQFVAGDVGKRVTGPGIPPNTTITARSSATTVTMSAAASATASGLTVVVGAGIITMIGKYSAVRNLQIQGGGNASDSSTNPNVGAAIDLGLGASFANVENVDFIAVNGWCLLAETVSASGLYGGVYKGLRGNYNAKGIRVAGTADNRDGQVFLDDLDLQVVQAGHVLEFDGINDAQVGKVNGSVSGAVAAMYGLNIVGNGSSVFVDNWDVGTYPNIPGAGAVIHIGGGTPNNVRVNGGISQGGSPSVLIDGGFNVMLRNLQISRGGGAGVRVTGGDLIDIVDNTFARNGYVAGSGQCEIEVTSTTARVRIARNRLTTPYGTGSQQVDSVFKLVAGNKVTVVSDNVYTGGHLLSQRYAGGILPAVLEGARVDVVPADHTLAGWSFDPAMAAGNTPLPVAGMIYGARLLVTDAQTISTIFAAIATAGVSLTGGYAALYDAVGNFVAQTVDQAAGWGSSGLKPMALTAPVVLQPGWYDAGLCFRGTTSPAFIRGGAHAAVNVNLAATSSRFWSADASQTTTAPANLPTKAASSVAWWVGVG
jgi:hypothetical protein